VISAGGSFGQLSVHVGADWRVWCDTYPESTPILNIGVASTGVVLCIADERISAEAVSFARKLAREAERFAADVERLNAAQKTAARDKAADPAV
jgi:hypothetical protein